MIKIKRLKNSQKMRIIISGVGIYTTVKQIRWGLFGFTNQVAASQKALDALEGMRSGIAQQNNVPQGSAALGKGCKSS